MKKFESKTFPDSMMDPLTEAALAIEFFDRFQIAFKWTDINTVVDYTVITTPQTPDDEERDRLRRAMLENIDRLKVVMATLEFAMLRRTGREILAHETLRPLANQVWGHVPDAPEWSSCIARHAVIITKFVLESYLFARKRGKVSPAGEFVLDIESLVERLNDGGYAGKLTWCTPAIAWDLVAQLDGLVVEQLDPERKIVALKAPMIVEPASSP